MLLVLSSGVCTSSQGRSSFVARYGARHTLISQKILPPYILYTIDMLWKMSQPADRERKTVASELLRRSRGLAYWGYHVHVYGPFGLASASSGAYYKVTERREFPSVRVRRIDEPLVRSPLDLDGSCPWGSAAARSDEDQAIIASATVLCTSTVCTSNSATATASPAWLPPGVVDEPLWVSTAAFP
jgi:hypothetical protein